MTRTAGTYSISTTLGESVRAFMPQALPPVDPALSPEVFTELNRQAELALARLAGVSGLVPSVDWLLYSTLRKEALLTSQIEGTQATLTDLFDEEAGCKVSNVDDVEEVTNYLRAFRWTQEQLRDPKGLPISVRLLCEAHRRLLIAALFEHWGLLSEPLMYLSGYLKQHQSEYYRRLSAIRTEGEWESWVTFFLEGVITAAGDAEKISLR